MTVIRLFIEEAALTISNSDLYHCTVNISLVMIKTNNECYIFVHRCTFIEYLHHSSKVL